MSREPVCSFCDTSRLQVGVLIQNNDAYICENCVSACLGLVLEQIQSSQLHLNLDQYNEMRCLAKETLRLFEDEA